LAPRCWLAFKYLLATLGLKQSARLDKVLLSLSKGWLNLMAENAAQSLIIELILLS